MRGFLETEFMGVSGDGRPIPHRLKARLGLTALVQDLGSHLFTRSTPGTHTQLALQAPEVLDARLRGLADLFVGDSIADTYVHALI